MPASKWTFKSAAEEARKYDSVRAFKSGSNGAYCFAERKGILKDITAHYSPKGSRRRYTKQYVAELAAPFDSVSDFIAAHPTAYAKASGYGFLSEVTAHMTRKQKPAGWWGVKENVAEVASWFESRWEWGKSHPTSYNAACRNGWLDDPEVTGHMVSKVGAKVAKVEHEEPAPKEPEIHFGSAVQHYRNADRIRLGKEAITKLMVHGKPQFRYRVWELVDKFSPNYRKLFARCNKQERDQVLKELHDAGVIRVDILGDVLNPNVDPRTSEFFTSEPIEMYLMTNPEMPGWVKGGQSKDSGRRANDMKTAAPADYVIERVFKLPRGAKDKDIHPYLEMVAGASNREWFYMPVEVAAEVIQLAISEDLDAIKRIPRCEAPGLRLNLHNNLRAGLALSRKLRARQTEVLYDADFLAFS